VSSMKLRFQKASLRPPPFVDLLFEAELENTNGCSLWFLFPLYMDESLEFGHFLASAVEISEPPGRGQLRLARFLGNGSFQVVRLPPGAHVRVHELPITYIGEPPRKELNVPVILAEQLRIGDQNAEDWFPIDLTSTPQAEVTDEPGAIVASQDTPGAKPVSVTLSGTQALKLCVRL
jgi:hypothetical protein